MIKTIVGAVALLTLIGSSFAQTTPINISGVYPHLTMRNKLGKPRGQGGAWKDSAVKAGVPSDPYLMTAYDQKSVELSAITPAKITLEVDVDGTDLWVPYRTFDLKPGETLSHEFPEGLSAYWVRAISDSDTTASVWFEYE